MSDEKLQTHVRREQITQAALELIAAHGLPRLNVAAVARRVGLVPSGIYRHFKSKDQIVEAVLELLVDRLRANLAAAREESPDALIQLRGVLMRHIRFLREGRALPQIIFSDDIHAGHPERKQRVVRMLEFYVGQISAIIRLGQEQGRIAPQVDPESGAMMLLGIVAPAGIRWHLTDGGFDVTRHAQRCWQIYSRGLIAEGASECAAAEAKPALAHPRRSPATPPARP